jgi:type I restriction enzyme S subunit
MTKKPDAPAIRFKGFSDAWEQRKVSELAEKTYGGGTPSTLNEAYWDGDIPWIQSSDVVDGRLFGVVPRKRITQYGLNNSATQLVPKNSIAIITRVGVGKLAFMPYSYATSQDFLSLSKLNAEPLFTVYACYKKLQSELNAVQGTSIKGITKDELLAKTVMVPQYAEQQQIGAFFSQLDNLITLHQRKFEKLTNVKKSMLEKMFPQNGCSYPEIRFKGFTDAWEQRKLEDYLTVSAEKNTGNIYGRSDVLSVSGDYGIVNQIEFQGRSFAGASVSNYGVVQTGDVVYTKSPLNSNPYGIIKTNKGKPGIVSTLYAVYHPKENAFSDFIQVYFEQHARMNNYMHPLVNKGAKNDMKVSAENALKGPVCFPSRIEQESISAFFSVLDNLITLHQRELEKLQNIKKSMLEKMFVYGGTRKWES